MKNLIIIGLLTTQLLDKTFAVEEPIICSPKNTISAIYEAMNRILCMGLFYQGTSPQDQYNETAKCRVALTAAGGAIIGAGLAGSSTYDAVKTNKSQKQVRDLTKKIQNNLDEMIKLRINPEALNKNLISVYRMYNKSHSALLHGAEKSLARHSKVSNGIMNSFGKVGLRVAAVGMLTTVGLILDGSPAGCGSNTHLYIDHDSKCRPTPKIGNHVSRFLALSKEEQIRIMGEDRRLCPLYKDLAENLSKEWNKNFKAPFPTIKACDASGKVSEASFTYPNPPYNGTSISINRNETSITFSMPGKRSYEILTQPGWGSSSISTVRVKLKSGVSKAYPIRELLEKPRKPHSIYLQDSLRIVSGMDMIDQIVKNSCNDYLNRDFSAEQQSSETSER